MSHVPRCPTCFLYKTHRACASMLHSVPLPYLLRGKDGGHVGQRNKPLFNKGLDGVETGDRRGTNAGQRGADGGQKPIFRSVGLKIGRFGGGMVLRAGRTCTKSFVFNGSFSTSQNMQYVNSCCQNPPKTLNAKDLFRFIGVLSALLFFKKDGANGAGTRFDQSPPRRQSESPKPASFSHAGSGSRCCVELVKIAATPPLANREFLQRGAGSRCGARARDTLR